MNNKWNDIALIYNEGQGEVGDPLHQHMVDPAIIKMLGNIQGQIILDAGCGNGYWVRRLAKQAKKVIGIDGSSELIDKAKSADNSPNVEYYVADLMNKIDLSNEYFDTIISSMVFQYLSDIKNAVSEFKRMLKPKGRVIISIQHPIFQYNFHAQKKCGGDTGPFSNPVGYFEHQIVEQSILSGKSKIEIYNRTISDYIQAFLGDGFVLTDCVEPEYSDDLLSKVPRYKEVSDIPRVIILSFQKK